MITQVNLRKMLEDKMHKKPNRFLVALIRWVLIEDWLNEHMANIGDKEGVDFMQGVVDELDIKVEVTGEENLPKAGTPYMFVCNHPLGGVDVVSVASVVGWVAGSVGTSASLLPQPANSRHSTSIRQNKRFIESSFPFVVF